MSKGTPLADRAPSAQIIGMSVLSVLTRRQRLGQSTTLDDLVEALAVRRADVRRVVSALHRQGFVDALRMRVTLTGLAIGVSLRKSHLASLAPEPAKPCHGRRRAA